MHIKNSDKAYIAGIIDGEGTVQIRKQRIYKDTLHIYPEVSIHNTHKPLMCYIQKLYNGKITCAKPSRTRKKKLFRIRFNRKESEIVLDDVIPYLVIKQTQALLCLELFTTFQKRVDLKRNKKGQIKRMPKKQ